MWSETAGDALLAHVFGGVTYPQPDEWWVQLHYGQPGPDGLWNGWEAAGRQRVDWDAVLGGLGIKVSLIDVEWDELPNAGGNESIGFCTIWSDETGGDCLQICTLDTTKTAEAGSGFKIPAGSLILSWEA